MKKNIKKSKYKKISQKTNINIKIGNTKPPRRQNRRKTPTRVLPPSPYIINPYGLALNNNPGFIKQDNDVFNKKLMNMLMDQNDQYKKSTLKIEELPTETKEAKEPANYIKFEDLPRLYNQLETDLIPKTLKSYIGGNISEVGDKSFFNDIIEPETKKEYGFPHIAEIPPKLDKTLSPILKEEEKKPTKKILFKHLSEEEQQARREQTAELRRQNLQIAREAKARQKIIKSKVKSMNKNKPAEEPSKTGNAEIDDIINNVLTMDSGLYKIFGSKR